MAIYYSYKITHLTFLLLLLFYLFYFNFLQPFSLRGHSIGFSINPLFRDALFRPLKVGTLCALLLLHL